MEDLNKSEPVLSGIKKEQSFKVPEGYFASFSTRLNDKIHAADKTVARGRSVIILKPYLAAAIVVIIALLAGRYFLTGKRDNRASGSMHAAISRAVEQDLYSISEETILEVMQANERQVSTDQGINQNEAIDYLMNETLNEEELLNEL